MMMFSTSFSSSLHRGPRCFSKLSSQLLLWLLLLSLSGVVVKSRRTSGVFQLNGEKSEFVLASFGIGGAHGVAEFQGSFTIRGDRQKYENNSMKLHLYADIHWDDVLKATTCHEKTKYASQTYDIPFDQQRANKDIWVSRVASTQFNQDELLSAAAQSSSTVVDHSSSSNKPHYWYFVVDDCSLEEFLQDDRVPEVGYWLKIRNLTDEQRPIEFSWDEMIYPYIHDATLAVTGVLGAYMVLNILYTIRTKNSVHLIKFLVLLAIGIDFLSSVFEVIHLRRYSRRGIGLTLFDAIAANLEAVCDAILAIVLLTLASGWTLPSDIVTVQNNADATTIFQSVVAGLSSPTSGGKKSPSAFSSSRNHPSRGINLFFLVSLFIIAIHLALALWGRIYNNNFDSYHDLHHLPGKILMGVRAILGMFMVAAITQTKSRCTMKSLHSFYNALMVVGTLWFQSLPLITSICNSSLVPYHLRHPVVEASGTTLQLSFLSLLSVIVTIHSSFPSYHKHSHVMQSEKIQPATLSLSTSSFSSGFKFGKMKINID